jgi:ANTAR domain/GAF domain
MSVSGTAAADQAAAIRRSIAADPAASRDLVGLLGSVSRVAARELTASGVGVTVMTGDGARGVYAASDPVSERLEDLQFALGEGPCRATFDERRPVLVSDLSQRAARWPVYVAAAYADGLRAVFAFPLQMGAARLGVLDVFQFRTGLLTDAQLRTAFLLTDLTVEALLDREEGQGRGDRVDGLGDEVGNRAQLYQAQGMVMVQLGVPLAEALVRMRAYAFAENRPLQDVARDVVNRTLSFDRDVT